MPTLCSKCNQPIKFKKLANGKYCPTNMDGSDHWDVCSSIKNKGKVYKPLPSEWFKGKYYIETKCDCLPWDGCRKCSSAKQDVQVKQKKERSTKPKNRKVPTWQEHMEAVRMAA